MQGQLHESQKEKQKRKKKKKRPKKQGSKWLGPVGNSGATCRKITVLNQLRIAHQVAMLWIYSI
jgi:hypothetical protein